MDTSPASVESRSLLGSQTSDSQSYGSTEDMGKSKQKSSRKANHHGHSHDGPHGHGHSHGGASPSHDHEHEHDDHDHDDHNHNHGHGGGDDHKHEHEHQHEHYQQSAEDERKATIDQPITISVSPPSRLLTRTPSASTRDRAHVPLKCSLDTQGLAIEQVERAKKEKENKTARRKLWIAAGLCCLFMCGEFIGGIYANSLSLMTDAAHLLSDLAGFMISLTALWITSLEPALFFSFGFHRAEILGALLSVLLIWALTGVLVYEAILRVLHPPDVDGRLMFIVASAGLAVNIVMGLVLHQAGVAHGHGLGSGHDHDHGHSHGGARKVSRSHAPHVDEHEESSLLASARPHGHSHGRKNSHGHSHGGQRDSPMHSVVDSSSSDHHGHAHGHENINVKAAFIHVIGDAIQSVGVMIAGGVIWYRPEWKIADPICTFLFSVLVLGTTIRLVKQSVSVLMEGVPEGISPHAVEDDLSAIDGVLEVHDLHIWSLSVGKPTLSCHIITEDDAQDVLFKATRLCSSKYHISHTTIQVERESERICQPEHH